MKIYNVQILKDMNNCYDGLDDTEILTYATLKEAEEALSTECTKAVEFLAEYTSIDEINIDKTESNFSITDGSDYIHGRIKEAEFKLNLYSIVTISVDSYEPCAINQYFALSKEEADKKYKEEVYKFIERIKENVLDEDESIDDFISENVRYDYEFTNGNRYYHAVYGEGNEFAINMEIAEIK